jgi:hypothetical protein
MAFSNCPIIHCVSPRTGMLCVHFFPVRNTSASTSVPELIVCLCLIGKSVEAAIRFVPLVTCDLHVPRHVGKFHCRLYCSTYDVIGNLSRDG